MLRTPGHSAFAAAGRCLFAASLIVAGSRALPARAQQVPTPFPADGYWAMFAPPAPRANHTLVYDSRRHRMILFGGNLMEDIWALSLDGASRWTQIVPQGIKPGVRRGHSAIYDPVGDRMIVYGGNDNTSNFPVGSVWALSLAGTPTWMNITPSSGPAPPARQDHGAVYDPAGQRMIVFGGSSGFIDPRDAWALSLTGTPSWTELLHDETPAGKVVGSFYDAGRNRVVAFFPDFTDLERIYVLTLDGAPAWSLLPETGPTPPDRRRCAIAYDAAEDRALVFGGEYGGYRNDVWQLKFGATNEWTQITPVGPLPSEQAAMEASFDPVTNRMVIFGGEVCCSPGGNSTWALSVTPTPSWSEIVPGALPPGQRSRHTAVFDTHRERTILFAGFSGSSSCCADTWTLEGTGNARWTELQPAGTLPPQRYLHSAIYDPVGDRMVTFGGRAGPALIDLWSLSLAGNPEWIELHPQGASPGERYSHSAIYDPVRRRMIVFGGTSPSSFGLVNDVWALSLEGVPTWTKLATQGDAPSPRDRHTAIYDAAGDRMIVFGGWTFGEDGYAWALSLSGVPTWTKFVPASGPVPRSRVDHVAVYDSDRQRMLIYGGLGGNNAQLDDLWALSLGASPAWTRLSPDGFQPGPAGSQAAVYDPVKQRMLMFFTHSLEPGELRPWQLLFRSPNQSPDVGAARAVPGEIDGRNHAFIEIAIDGVADPDGDPIAITVKGVTQDEPVQDHGSGNTCPDARIVDGKATVRAERSGTGNGRVYRVAFTATDPSGASTDGAVTVCVPHHSDEEADAEPAESDVIVETVKGGRAGRQQRLQDDAACVDDGQQYVSTGSCGQRVQRGKVSEPSGNAPGLRVRHLAIHHVEIEWSMPDPDEAIVALYDVSGRLVRRIHSGHLPAGVHVQRMDLAGVRSGIYFCRLQTAHASVTQPLVAR